MKDIETFRDFQRINECREIEAHRYEKCHSWRLNNWVLALAGEVGELANLVKKIERGDFTQEAKLEEICDEVADIITYADLIYTHLGVDTQNALLSKFEKINQRIGWKPSIT